MCHHSCCGDGARPNNHTMLLQVRWPSYFSSLVEASAAAAPSRPARPGLTALGHAESAVGTATVTKALTGRPAQTQHYDHVVFRHGAACSHSLCEQVASDSTSCQLHPWLSSIAEQQLQGEHLCPTSCIMCMQPGACTQLAAIRKHLQLGTGRSWSGIWTTISLATLYKECRQPQMTDVFGTQCVSGHVTIRSAVPCSPPCTL